MGEFEQLLSELENGPTVRRDPLAGRFEAAAREALARVSRPAPMRKAAPAVDFDRLISQMDQMQKSLPKVDPVAEPQAELRKAIATVDGYAEKAIAIGRPDLACRFEAYRNRMAAGL